MSETLTVDEFVTRILQGGWQFQKEHQMICPEILTQYIPLDALGEEIVNIAVADDMFTFTLSSGVQFSFRVNEIRRHYLWGEGESPYSMGIKPVCNPKFRLHLRMRNPGLAEKIESARKLELEEERKGEFFMKLGLEGESLVRVSKREGFVCYEVWVYSDADYAELLCRLEELGFNIGDESPISSLGQRRACYYPEGGNMSIPDLVEVTHSLHDR